MFSKLNALATIFVPLLRNGRIETAIEKNAKSLDLSNLNLINVPIELERVNNLITLFLNDNQLTNVSIQWHKLTRLKGLNLSDNRLRRLPAEIGEIYNLTTLYLNDNELAEVPVELGNLYRLKTLELNDNLLTTLPANLGKLQSLIELYVCSNRLINVPEELGKLQNLNRLVISDNQLSSVPARIGQLQNLSELDLSENQLLNIPAELGRLQNLRRLDLRKNPSLNLPPELFNRGTRAILNYLCGQLDGSKAQWTSKLLVVGEGGVGKTSLLRALRGETFDSQESTTHGVEIKNLHLSHPTLPDISMKVNTWDFGGQEIYHATHQFFLTNRSLYILTWNARLEYEQGKLYYWLKTIRANAPDAPILIVATHIDQRNADLPLSEFQSQFPKIIGHYSISSKDNIGIEQLREAIANAAANLPLMGEIWPQKWLEASIAIREHSEKYIPTSSLWLLMQSHQVEKKSHLTLARWLHELGDILFFDEDETVNDLVILQPQWVTQYISKVLESPQVIERNGIFTRHCMDQIWSDLRPELRNHFLRLMERFDLSYRTLEDQDISLVVERLAHEPPNYKELWNSLLQQPYCKELSMKFQLSEILAGIPTWFIARQHRFTTNNHWRTGVLFAYSNERKHLGLVQILTDSQTNSKYLQLAVRGPMPHNFFDLLKEGIELTLRRYPGLVVTRFLPCPDPSKKDCPHEFDYVDLTNRLELNPPRTEAECPKCFQFISVTQLLFGLHHTTEEQVLNELHYLSQNVQAGFIEMKEGFDDLRELTQREFLRQCRSQQRLAESYCPNVFALRPDDRGMWTKDLEFTRINLQLYCQEPGHWHPAESDGLYPIDVPKQWLKKMAPHIRRLVKVMKYAAPLAKPVLGVQLPDMADDVKADVTLMKSLIDKLPDIEDPSIYQYRDEETPHSVSGEELRYLRYFLDEQDPQHCWGHLERVLTPEGDFLWLCKEHAKKYKP